MGAWTSEQLALLRKLWPTKTHRNKIAERIGRSRWAIYNKAEAIGLKEGTRGKVKACAANGCENLCPERGKYCSRRCYGDSLRKTERIAPKICDECGNRYCCQESENKLQFINRKTCGIKCSEARKRRMAEEAKASRPAQMQKTKLEKARDYAEQRYYYYATACGAPPYQLCNVQRQPND